MNRLRKFIHVGLVWGTVGLIAVDPAAACRLLARRSCGWCGPVNDTEAVKLPAASASNAAENAPLEPSATLSMPIAPMRASQSATIDVPEPADPQPVAIPRQPADAAAPPVAGVAVPAPEGRTQPLQTSSPPSAPMSTNLSQPITSQSNANMRLPSAESSPSGPSALLPANLRQGTPEPRIISPPGPLGTAEKSPAILTPSSSREPIAPPAFPPAADDPFAPLKPASPNLPADIDDDPFAPPRASVAKPAARPTSAPSAGTFESQPSDPLLPTADGRLPMRQWLDTSGQFRVTARLILIFESRVRLLKENGRTTTVPLERLSRADREYVAEIVSRYGQDLSKLDQLAAR